jgi:Fic family protein
MEYKSATSAIESLDKKNDNFSRRLKNASENSLLDFWYQMDLSLIYHDWALEGQVVLPEELSGAFNNRAIADSTSLPLYIAIRHHKQAFETMRELAEQKKLPISVDLFKKFHAYFASDPESAKSGRYRKDIPLHRSYFHEICPPNKISSSVRKLTTWANDADNQVSMHPILWATEFHFQFMRVFPFIETTGKVGRTVMNLMLVRSGYLPAVIHATERQRYYESIRQSPDDLAKLIIESEMASLDAANRFLRRSVRAS